MIQGNLIRLILYYSQVRSMKKNALYLLLLCIPSTFASEPIVKNLIPEQSDKGLIEKIKKLPTELEYAITQEILTQSGTKAFLGQEVGPAQSEEMQYKTKIYSAAFSSSETSVLTTSQDSITVVWNLKNNQPLISLEHGQAHLDFAKYSENETRIVTVADKTLFIWDTATGKKLQQIPSESTIYSAMFNREATQLLTACENGKAAIWEVASGNCLQEFQHDALQVSSAVYNVDESHILTVSYSHENRTGTATWWDIHDKENKKTFSTAMLL